jgi:ribosome-associated protein
MTDAAPIKPERKRTAGAAAAPKDPSGLPSRAAGGSSRPKSTRARAASRAADDAAAGPQVSAAEEAARREALELAHRAVDLAADKKASDIVLLELNGLTTLTDYFVICSGGSERQLQAIADGIAEGLRDEGQRPLGREGGASAHWLLLDYGSVIIHVMAQPEREYYGLEKLWSEAPLLLRVL